ncbi:hypothetical protein PR048_017202 [Dryococelus australis]|uniref:Uncharacterized protein n=1 Tax=Dryococelus australis TaxID=614101 RepID=A0ABQ9H8X2_9NEOP|nr:hypothetical protein PR048_017202 [Dryococelus australis]
MAPISPLGTSCSVYNDIALDETLSPATVTAVHEKKIITKKSQSSGGAMKQKRARNAVRRRQVDVREAVAGLRRSQALSHCACAMRATFCARCTTSRQRFLRTSRQSWKKPSFLGKPWLPSQNVTRPGHTTTRQDGSTAHSSTPIATTAHHTKPAGTQFKWGINISVESPSKRLLNYKGEKLSCNKHDAAPTQRTSSASDFAVDEALGPTTVYTCLHVVRIIPPKTFRKASDLPKLDRSIFAHAADILGELYVVLQRLLVQVGGHSSRQLVPNMVTRVRVERYGIAPGREDGWPSLQAPSHCYDAHLLAFNNGREKELIVAFVVVWLAGRSLTLANRIRLPIDFITRTLPMAEPVPEGTSYTPVGKVALARRECALTMSPDAASSELALELHAVRAPEHSVPMEPALHELAFVPAQHNHHHGTCQKILSGDLNMSCVTQHGVPRILTKDQCDKRVTICGDMLSSADDSRIMTRDEIWCFLFDPQLKRQSASWESPSAPLQKNCGKMRSCINNTCYVESLHRLRDAIRRRRRELSRGKNWLLLSDNAPTHHSVLVQDELARQQCGRGRVEARGYSLGAVGEAHDSQAGAEAVLEATVVARAVGQREMAHAVLLAAVVPVADVARAVLVAMRSRLHHAGHHAPRLGARVCRQPPATVCTRPPSLWVVHDQLSTFEALVTFLFQPVPPLVNVNRDM